MKQQTYILEVWHDAPSYNEAARKTVDGDNTTRCNFFRFSCIKASTVKMRLARYIEEAAQQGLQFLYPSFFAESGMYRIVSTPDGYNEGATIERGYISNLIKQPKQ